MHPYAYALEIGAKELVHRDFKHAIRHLVMPVGYWRLVEYQLVQDACKFAADDRILDIGSPKLLSIYLAKTLRADVYATDIDDYFVPEYTLLRRVEKLPPARFHVQTEDGRHLSFPDNTFSKIFSVSVLEHIPDNGDAECAREIGRVLAPGGLCAVTVPFSPTSRVEYKKASQVYWASSNGGEDIERNRQVFFQRRYSESDLYDRLIRPSGLALAELKFVGERVLTSASKEVSSYVPFYPMAMIGLAHPVLSRLFHTPPAESWRELSKPLCALVVLQKPA